ncbi:MAG: Sporulation kinase E [Syntrophorhabdus sp. PtaU1.Bin050]|nr:MAG: Sporulation kinase E [Syntrophorhabdus sp. PtaU1.Bin050]
MSHPSPESSTGYLPKVDVAESFTIRWYTFCISQGMPASEAQLLQDAFQEFSKASDSIINYYGVLENQIRELKKEVEEKNKELQRAGEFLYNLLNSLPVGVVVTNTTDILFANKTGRKLGSTEVLGRLNSGGRKSGELKNKTGHYRWKKENLESGFESKEVIVFEDVTEVERMKERVERDERLMAMGEMAARIAHEIKNPLGSMELFLSMLLDGKLKKKEKQYANYILFGVKTVDRIINNILTYTKPKTLTLSEGTLSRVVKDTADFMKVSAETRGITLKLDMHFDGPSHFDPDLMKLVLMNFISNAIEAISRPDGSIVIDVKEETEHAVITITDNGAGMSEEVQKSIFNPFFTTKDKGVGLGLFIVYNIIKAHGGYVEVESVEGSGTSFSLYIPKDGP